MNQMFWLPILNEQILATEVTILLRSYNFGCPFVAAMLFRENMVLV